MSAGVSFRSIKDKIKKSSIGDSVTEKLSSFISGGDSQHHQHSSDAATATTSSPQDSTPTPHSQQKSERSLSSLSHSFQEVSKGVLLNFSPFNGMNYIYKL